MPVDFSCPISGEQRDNTTVRVVAGFVFVVGIATLLVTLILSTQTAAIIVGILAIDFIIRGLIKPKYSPLATLARGIVSGLNLKRNMVDNAPKIFAARIGIFFTVLATILLAFNQIIPGVVVIGILLACAILESAFSFCLGCWMYSLLPGKVRNALAKDILK